MSYAEVASKGPKQTPAEAAAPQPPRIEMNESASTSSLIDVDHPSVRTVPSDFGSQDIQTETQAARIEREDQEREARARAEADLAKKKARNKASRAAHDADSWIARQLEGLSDGASGALAAANVLAAVGISTWMGYKAWGLYDHGRLSWKHVGVGLVVLGAVGAFEGTFARYLYRAKGKKQ